MLFWIIIIPLTLVGPVLSQGGADVCPHAWFNCREEREEIRCYIKLGKLKVS